MEIEESVDARKERIDREEAAAMLAGAERVFVARGRKIQVHEPDGGAGDGLMAVVMGRSGNLRAPTLKVGRAFLVGYNDELYEDFFG